MLQLPDVYLLVVGFGVVLVVAGDIATWVCGCFDARTVAIAYGPFQSDPPTRMFRAYSASKIIMYSSSVVLYTIISTAINPADWSLMTILHGLYFLLHFLWVPCVRVSIARGVKWLAVVIVWLSTMTMLGILVLLWVDDTHPIKSETDLRVAISACTMVFFHHLFWDSYVWSVYFDPNWDGEQTMPCTMPTMSSDSFSAKV